MNDDLHFFLSTLFTQIQRFHLQLFATISYFQQRIVVDCRGHLLGRLASKVAKELLNGQKIVAVRTEEIVISGSCILLFLFSLTKFK